MSGGRGPEKVIMEFHTRRPGVLIVPDAIADLARRASPPENCEGARLVLADWLEERGHLKDARFLRPRSEDVGDDLWELGRRWVLRAVLEAWEKRDALRDLAARKVP